MPYNQIIMAIKISMNSINGGGENKRLAFVYPSGKFLTRLDVVKIGPDVDANDVEQKAFNAARALGEKFGDTDFQYVINDSSVNPLI